MTTKKQLEALCGNPLLLSMAACQNAWLGLRENNIDPEHPDNADLVLMNWIEGIRFLLSCEEYLNDAQYTQCLQDRINADLVKTFKNIGITA